MFRRCFLTAAAAVTIALVAPSTSKADFTVNVSGAIPPGGQQVTGESLIATRTSTGITLPPIGIGTVGALSGITGTGTGNTLSLSFPALFSQSPVGSSVGLAGTTAFPTSPDAAGVYVGATFAQSQGTAAASVTSTSTIYVLNNTNATETITITVNGAFTAPGTAGSLLNVVDKLTDLGFVNYGGAPAGGSDAATDNISFFGTAISAPSLPVSSGTLSFSGTAPVGSSFNNFLFTDNGTYSLQQTVTITLAAGNSVSFQARMDDSLVFAPAPSGLVMGLAGVPFLGLGFLRRRMGRVTPTVA